MALVSANLLYIVIYGTQLACHLDSADGQLDPAEGENGGYIYAYLLLATEQHKPTLLVPALL